MDFIALERLGRLRASGALSEDEFEREKQRILGTPRRVEASAERVIAPPVEQPSLDELPMADPAPAGPSMTKVLVVLAVVFVVGVVAIKYFLPLPSGENNPGGASEKYSVRSQVKGMRIAPTTELPVNPHGSDQSCDRFEVPAVGEPGKLVASQGWHVTGEVKVGQFDAVSFVGACQRVSDTAFQPIDGNIGIYEGESLRAVIYGKGVGHIRPSESRNQLRITDETGTNDIGKLHVTSTGISVRR